MNNSFIVISEFSVLTTLVIMPILVVAMFFLRKSKYFVRFFGVNSMLVLYFACAFRLCVPIEITDYTWYIDDRVVMTKINDALWNKSELTENLPIKLMDILLIAWGVGTLIYLAVVLIRYNLSVRKYSRSELEVPEKYALKLSEAKDECSIRCNIKLIVSDFAPSAMSFGVFKKTVILPAGDYTDDGLGYILAHECTHLKNRDTLIKLMTEIFVAIFWWNPFAYLLKKDLSHVLEIKCDQIVLAEKSPEERIHYFELLLGQMSSEKKLNASPVLTAEFAHKEDDRRTLQRFDSILKGKSSKKMAIAINIVSLVCALVLVFSTFFVQWRSNYSHLYPVYDEEGELLSSGENSYIIKKDDGTYLFVFEAEDMVATEPLTQEDIDSGMYYIYQIREE